MLKQTFLTAALILGLSSSANTAVITGEIRDVDFSFEGPFGAFDQFQLQRGLQVYSEVCSACHGISQVYFRNLGDEDGLGYSEAEVKAYAANYLIYDREIDDDRDGIPSDKFPDTSIEGAPDLSLMAKARAGFSGPYGTGLNQLFKGMGGPEYIAALLTGYTGKEKEEAGQTYFENTAFPGGWIAMPPPTIYEGEVEYADGSSNDAESVSEDVAAFLMWTAEPKLMARKRAGFTAVIFLGILAVMLFFTNKKLWAPVKRKEV